MGEAISATGGSVAGTGRYKSIKHLQDDIMYLWCKMWSFKIQGLPY